MAEHIFSYRQSNAPRKTDIYQVKPTLLVGLGGTGKEVLLRLRQRFFEKYDTIGFPTMAYLWIDTDVQNQNIDGKPITYIDLEARFKADEQVDAQVNEANFQAIFANPNQNRHIFRWIYPSLSAQGSVINGSRQIRPLGRLGFFHAYSNIRQRLETLSHQVLSQNARQEMQNRYGIQVDTTNALQIILVCSLAGGTGSGMFLDAAFLIRYMFEGSNPDIIGYLVLPPVFSPSINNSERIYANAYASLKELEFYSMRKDLRQGEAREQIERGMRVTSAHDFVVDWENRGRPLSITGPPFNTCYLINNQTMGGGSIGPEYKTHLCDMIAENIFMDFHAQAFSDKKRSVRSNLDVALTGELEYHYLNEREEPFHSDVFSCRFSTLGFSMIYVPTDRIRKACAYKLGLDLLDSWLAHREVPGTLKETLRERVLAQLGLRVGRNADDFRVTLERSNDAGQTFWQEIAATWSNQIRNGLLDRVQLATPNLRAEIDRRMQDYAKDMLDKPAEQEHWGIFVRRLELHNRRMFLDNARRAILTVLRDWLKDDRIRFAAASAYLGTLHTILEEHQQFFMRARDRATQGAEHLRSEIRTLGNIISDEESGWLVHRWSLRALVEEVCEKIRQHFEQRMRSLVFGTAAELCQDLQAFIGTQQVETQADGSEVVTRSGLIQDNWRLMEQLRAMRQTFADRMAAFDRWDEHLIFVNLYRPEMFKNYYKMQRSDGMKVDIDLRHMENLFYSDKQIDGPYDFKALAEKIGLTNVQRTLEQFCLSRFSHLDIDVDAAHTLFERYPDDNARHQVLSHFVRNGTVWLRPSRRAQTEQRIIANYDDDVEIGIYQAGMEHHHYQEIYQTILQLAQAAKFRGPVNPPVDVRQDAVYLYSEIAGIPLVYIDNIEAYKRVYSELARAGKEIHLDSRDEQFTDIIVQDSQEVAETIRINHTLFVGSILRVVELSGTAGRAAQYHYLDRRNLTTRRLPLGTHTVAVETLRSDQNLLQRIEQEVRETRRKLSTRTRWYFLTTLMYHIMDGSLAGTKRGPYPPVYITVGGQNIEKFSPEHRAIHGAIEEEQRYLEHALSLEKEEILQKALDLYVRLDAFSEPVVFGNGTHRILSAKAFDPESSDTMRVGSPHPA